MFFESDDVSLLAFRQQFLFANPSESVTSVEILVNGFAVEDDYYITPDDDIMIKRVPVGKTLLAWERKGISKKAERQMAQNKEAARLLREKDAGKTKTEDDCLIDIVRAAQEEFGSVQNVHSAEPVERIHKNEYWSSKNYVCWSCKATTHNIQNCPVKPYNLAVISGGFTLEPIDNPEVPNALQDVNGNLVRIKEDSAIMKAHYLRRLAYRQFLENS